ncbi:hypothetical protein [Brachybacterium sp. YJGR34]|uniref:hypothetical protein n=1 Tax=Brachybacterium sp. YJGR34 TaxID=2059911 RepID=UPI000E0AA7DD|nr:hypothetical protein [Brachybacterium sp. YJGR34]
MSFDLEPVELLACALTAVMLAIPVAFPLAAGVIAAPRRSWSAPGLATGLGLLLGVVLAAAGYLAVGPGTVATFSAVAMLLGLLGALGAAVLVIVQSEGSTLSTAVGVVSCALIGLAEPGLTLPAMLGLSRSVLVVLSAVVIEAVTIAVLVAFLVAAGGRVRALQIGVAVAGFVTAVLLGVGVLARAAASADPPSASQPALLITVLVALALGSIVGGVLEVMRERRRARGGSPTTRR